MLQQIAGEGDIQLNASEFEVNDEYLARELAGLEGDAAMARESEIRDAAFRAKDNAILSQSNSIITYVLGQRAPRSNWGSHDLKAKDAEEEASSTPARVRTVDVPSEPVPINFGAAITRPACKTGRKKPEKGAP
jgi:hypothetical protein